MPQRYRKRTINSRTYQEHRLVVQEELGRELRRDELVHHRNRDGLDNAPENLQVVTAAEHQQIHLGKYPTTKACTVCGTTFRPHRTKRKRAKTCSPACRSAAISAALTANPTIPPWAKLDRAKADEIRTRAAEGGISRRALARCYGVHHSQISAIVNGKAWA